MIFSYFLLIIWLLLITDYYWNTLIYCSNFKYPLSHIYGEYNLCGFGEDLEFCFKSTQAASAEPTRMSV